LWFFDLGDGWVERGKERGIARGLEFRVWISWVWGEEGVLLGDLEGIDFEVSV
jgi:hypothetical protein